jgi:putative FmdB family regulatory protein
MPIFEYACRACGHEFETLVRASETPSCAGCGSPELDKKLSVFAAQNAAAPLAASPAVSQCGNCGNPGGPGACGRHRH